MLLKILKNPYYTYILVWVAVMLTYSLGWSKAAPNLPFSVYFFFAISFLISFFLGKNFAIRIKKQEKIFGNNNLLGSFTKQYKPNWIILIFIILIYIIEFIDFGGIPLILVLKNRPYEYATFGIKTLHVFVHTFSTYYAIRTANLFLKTFNKKFLFQSLIICALHLMIFNRGSIVFIIVGLIFCFFQYIKKLTWVKIFILVIFAILGLYFYGLIGNIRSFNSNPYTILEISMAKESFVNGIIPKEFFWFYSYFALPLGTLAHNIANNVVNISLGSFYDFIILCVTPDFVSNRLPIIHSYEMLQFLPYFNVGTIYVTAFITMGWIGMFLIFLYQLLFIKIVEKLIPYNSPNYTVAMSLLTLIMIMNVFGNMLTFSGLILPLIYVILAEIFGRKKRKKHVQNKIFSNNLQ